MSQNSENSSIKLHIHTHDPDMKFDPPKRIAEVAHVQSFAQYEKMYEQSIKEPEIFWGEIAEQFYWASKPTGAFVNYNFDVRKGPISIKWMEGAKTNICYNVLDRNIEKGLGDKIAFFW